MVVGCDDDAGQLYIYLKDNGTCCRCVILPKSIIDWKCLIKWNIDGKYALLVSTWKVLCDKDINHFMYAWVWLRYLAMELRIVACVLFNSRNINKITSW